jgi:hypothetical protein
MKPKLANAPRGMSETVEEKRLALRRVWRR